MFASKMNMRLIDPLRETISAKLDVRRLFAARPELGKNYVERNRRVQDLLKHSYAYYKANVSPGGSAVSLETACFLYLWCETYRPSYILDLGSGYSSFVFRLYRKNVNGEAKIVSIDSSPEWLDKTAQYLAGEALSPEMLLTADALEKVELTGLDLAFLDIRPLDLRVRLMAPLFEKLEQRGALIIDDLHKPHFRPLVRSEAAALSARLFNIKGLTLDEYGRYVYVLMKSVK